MSIQYELPKSIDLGGKSYPIRWDMVAALDCITAMSDPNLSDGEKCAVLLGIIYKEEIPRKLQKDAVKAAFAFLDGGKQSIAKKSPKVVDWEQDFHMIAPAVNRVLGFDVRESPQKVHWWTFLGGYMEIGGDCSFAQIVSIRDKKARGKKLEKYEREYVRRNPGLFVVMEKETDEEKAFLEWAAGGKVL
jgi:hypothetical protein